MRFILKTLVDITETNARRGQDNKLVNQQANFNTMFHTIGLRVNIEPLRITNEVISLKEGMFGSIKGKHRVWTFEFENPYEGALTIDMLVNDFDLVPVITGLDETATINNIFRTTHPKDTNIVFEIVEK